MVLFTQPYPPHRLAERLDRILSVVGQILVGLAPGADPEDGVTPIKAGSTARAALAKALKEPTGAEGGALPPDLRLAADFGLSELDQMLLWFTSAPHLEPALIEFIRSAQEDDHRPGVDIALAIRALGGSRRDALALMARVAPEAPLINRGLIAVVSGRNEMRHNRMMATLVPAAALPGALCDLRTLSPDALAYTQWLNPGTALNGAPLDPNVERVIAPALQAFFRGPSGRTGDHGAGGLAATAGIVILIQGPPGVGRTTAVKALAGHLGRRVLEIDGPMLALATADAQRRCIAAVLEAAELFGDLVCIRGATDLIDNGSAVAPLMGAQLARRRVAALFCTGDTDAVDPALEPVVLLKHTIDPAWTETHIEAIWTAHLKRRGVSAPNIDLEALVRTISVTPLQVRKAVQLGALTAERPDSDGPDDIDGPVTLTTELLERSARAQISKSIGSLAVVEEPTLALEDLVLDPPTMNHINAVISAARHRRVVLEDWGVGDRIRRGTGIIALFDGEPGTGKTHAAEVIASELGLSLVRINVASVVDKYIGETEKNLTRIFQQARPDISLLLFDEADSLFSKRSTEVEKATDRYSNMDINVMLQLIERYPGVTILTTNLKQAIDKAFERRFTFKLHFELPGWEERERIWRYLLPLSVQTAEPIDYEEIADLELSGGEIKNAILLACYQAVLEDDGLRTRHLFAAGQREAAAAGRVVRRRNQHEDDIA